MKLEDNDQDYSWTGVWEKLPPESRTSRKCFWCNKTCHQSGRWIRLPGHRLSKVHVPCAMQMIKELSNVF